MTRKKQHGRGRRKQDKKRPRDSAEGGDSRGESRGAGYKEIERTNTHFEAYYKHIVPEGEWDEFIAACRSPLPATFRITGTRLAAAQLRDQLEPMYFRELEGLQVDGEWIEPPRPLPWYPDRLGWHLNVTRILIRKHDALRRFHRFLINESEQGNLTRQEAVSMIPPLLLDVQPSHKVLDMCAAPGSKTTQLIEALHGNNETMPTGMVIANDADHKRCYMLVHQAKRLQSPCFMVTNADASLFPHVHLKDKDGKDKPLVYDRILCDVPCSGDGTLRKNLLVWNKWNPQQGPGLHGLQIRITRRAVQLLAVGGLVTYSTCSFHPGENEAVVAAILREFKGMVELVDVSDKLPELKRTAGLSSWPILSQKDGELLRTFEDVPEKQRTGRFPKTLFSPTAEEAEWMHLEQCVRINPHQQNTGGFFIALLKKTAPVNRRDARRNGLLPDEPEAEAAEADGSTEKVAETGKDEPVRMGKKRQRVFKEEPYVFIDPDDEDIKAIMEFYGLADTFPKHLLLVRSSNPKKKNNIYYVSPDIHSILANAEQSSLKIINTAVKLFSRSDSVKQACSFRACIEGLDVVFPHMSDKRCRQATLDDFRALVSTEYVNFDRFSSSVADFCRSVDYGCIALHVPASAGCLSPIRLLAWRGESAVRLMIPTGDRDHLKILLGIRVEIELPPQQESKKPKAEEADDKVTADVAGGDEGDKAAASAEAGAGDAVQPMDQVQEQAQPEAAAVDAAT
eukprot:m.18125 g.18125  ORF g.18125 m.18125 type:complete len:737 (-) comp5633_c0_seq1:115-2325(-)